MIYLNFSETTGQFYHCERSEISDFQFSPFTSHEAGITLPWMKLTRLTAQQIILQEDRVGWVKI